MLQERYVLSPSGVEYAILDRGYSSLRSGHLDSAIGAQAMIQHRDISLVFVKEIIYFD